MAFTFGRTATVYPESFGFLSILRVLHVTVAAVVMMIASLLLSLSLIDEQHLENGEQKMKFWMIISAAVAVLSAIPTGYFIEMYASSSSGARGFVFTRTLLLVFTLACMSLTVSVAVWLWRKFQRNWLKITTAVMCVLVCAFGVFVSQRIAVWGGLPGAIPVIHVSPQGTNRVLEKDWWGTTHFFPMQTWFTYDPARDSGANIARARQYWENFTVYWESETRFVVRSECGQRASSVWFE